MSIDPSQDSQSQQQLSQNIINFPSINPDSFYFPLFLLNHKKLSGKNEFKKLLKKEAGITNKDQIWRFKKYKIMNNNQETIHIRCIKCSAYIIYYENENHQWHLKNYENHHSHYQKQLNQVFDPNKRKLKSYQNQKHIIYTLNSQISIQKNKKLFLKDVDFCKVKILLKSLDYDFYYQTNKLDRDDYPDILVAVSSQQKKSYQQYGQVISYDITYNCIKQISINGKRFGVGIFSGFDNNNRMLIFGFSITTFQKIQDFKIIFKQFFNLIGYIQTSAIITDQQPSITSALKELKEQQKYKFHHIFDNWHFIRSFRSVLQGLQQDIKSDLIIRLKRMMSQPDMVQGQIYLNQIKYIMLPLQLHNEYQRLCSKLDKVCLWKMPNQFVGLSLHSNQTLNHLLKTKVQLQVTIYELIQRLDAVSKQRISFCKNKKEYVNKPLQNIFDDPQIKIVRQKFQKKVFDKFLFFYNRSQFISQVSVDLMQSKYTVKNLMNKKQYLIEDWKCNCRTYQKIGIPCEHIIYISKAHNQVKKNYIDLINQRWNPLFSNKKNKKMVRN